MLRFCIIAIFFFSTIGQGFTQIPIYQDIFRGGVTGDAYNPWLSSTPGQFDIYIEPGSTIRKALLFVSEVKNPSSDGVINFNGTSLIVNQTFASSPQYNYISGSTIRTYRTLLIDVTHLVSPTQNSYPISIIQPLPIGGGFYAAFYLYVAYENPILNKVCALASVNDVQPDAVMNYSFSSMNTIDISQNVGLAIHSSDFCDTIKDGSYILIEGDTIGLLGGVDDHSPASCSGVVGSFYYQNNTLFGLGNDTANTTMYATDGIANIESHLINNNSINISYLYQSNFRIKSNPVHQLFLTYTTPCDTFTTTATTNIDTICQGESVQLSATGGVNYSWFSAFSTFNDSTLANPVATPTQTTTYIVTIKNDSGCVKTEHVKVWVNPTPKPDTITTTPQRCGSANGSITVGNIPNGTPPFTYQLTNLQNTTTTTQSTNTFTNLSTGYYQLSTSDSKGCQWQSDTLFVPVVNDITANFGVYTIPWSFPFSTNPIGVAPLTVYTQNSSVNANSYEWTISQQSPVDSSQDIIAQYTSFNTQHSFEDGGTFEICLLAYNNIPVCGDTACKTISITPNSGVDSLVFVVPNVFSPNHDGNNDNFVLQVQGVNLLEKIEVEIFNRWGQEVGSRKTEVRSGIPAFAGMTGGGGMTELVIWDGRTTSGTPVPEGTYFYVINYTKIPASAGMTGEVESLKGSVTLLR